jgi:CspA family cold shock protein
MDGTRKTGRVLKDGQFWWFIRADDPEQTKDIFVHWSSIDAKGFRALRRGQVVSFTLVESDERGPRAHAVRVEKGA